MIKFGKMKIEKNSGYRDVLAILNIDYFIVYDGEGGILVAEDDGNGNVRTDIDLWEGLYRDGVKFDTVYESRTGLSWSKKPTNNHADDLDGIPLILSGGATKLPFASVGGDTIYVHCLVDYHEGISPKTNFVVSDGRKVIVCKHYDFMKALKDIHNETLSWRTIEYNTLSGTEYYKYLVSPECTGQGIDVLQFTSVRKYNNYTLERYDLEQYIDIPGLCRNKSTHEWIMLDKYDGIIYEGGSIEEAIRSRYNAMESDYDENADYLILPVLVGKELVDVMYIDQYMYDKDGANFNDSGKSISILLGIKSTHYGHTSSTEFFDVDDVKVVYKITDRYIYAEDCFGYKYRINNDGYYLTEGGFILCNFFEKVKNVNLKYNPVASDRSSRLNVWCSKYDYDAYYSARKIKEDNRKKKVVSKK